jgi:hypothetical protein
MSFRNQILFKMHDVTVIDLFHPVIGSLYSVSDEDTMYQTSILPVLDYEILKQSLFEYQDMKDEDLKADNQTDELF